MSHFQIKILVLWNVFLLGLLFHTDLGLMPLFHGLNVAHSDPHQATADVGLIFWLMLAFFALPLWLMVFTAFNDSLPFRRTHFAMTVLYSVLNFFHLLADLMVVPVVWSQIALMLMLFLFGLGLNWVGFQWMREKLGSHPEVVGSDRV
ncbi:hypothetical protein L1047_12130 [Synechococcus sp. Nb3U1]|uniref:hypothetical protein n=1 Tax=Synechococcus sp. Nb3U1 TaxID=1914529 RepID=UPI001F1988F3|nr:hypothetical protein [Synechococcus sp. Nb3U1]MCF2971943.1 hypothetical protein [Synechococcus sp. Nb3U1]